MIQSLPTQSKTFEKFPTMSPTLKVLLPKSGSAYPATEPSKVNSSSPTPIDTPHFKGEISVWVKDYNGLQKEGDGNEYFGEPGREGMTYGITVRGEFVTGKGRPTAALDV